MPPHANLFQVVTFSADEPASGISAKTRNAMPEANRRAKKTIVRMRLAFGVMSAMSILF